jgi:ubiquinone biosynthesis protein UbiJ
MSLSALAVDGLERALNGYLALDPEARSTLAGLQGRVIAVHLLVPDLTLYLVPAADGLQVLQHIEGEPDCTLTGTPLALARLGTAREKADELFSGGVRISGDTELGRRFGEVLGGLEVDWEEQLSRLTGDVIAHQIGRGVRGLTRWAGLTGRTLEQDLGEYLQEEARLVPTRLEVEGLLRDVDELRDDVERLEARVARLERRRSGKAP